MAIRPMLLRCWFDKYYSHVAHALLCAVSRLSRHIQLSKYPRFKRRDEPRRDTQECVRHVNFSRNGARSSERTLIRLDCRFRFVRRFAVPSPDREEARFLKPPTSFEPLRRSRREAELLRPSR